MGKQLIDPVAGENWSDPVQDQDYIWINSLKVWAAKLNVSNVLYRSYAPEHDSGNFEGYSLNDDEQPVVSISYNEALDYCDWLQGRFIEAGCPDSLIVRLPSHQEWTALASCGINRDYPWGNNWPPTRGNYGDQRAAEAFPEWDSIRDYDDGYVVSCPVSEAGENEWGLIGVGGNVYEWTFVAGGTNTELRGASWSTYQEPYLRIDNRYPREPSSALINLGIRLIITV